MSIRVGSIGPSRVALRVGALVSPSMAGLCGLEEPARR